MGLKFGDEMYLYFCPDGIGGTPEWTEVPIVQTVKYAPTKDEHDVTIRGSGGYKMTAARLKDVSFDFDLVYDTEHPAFEALEAAWATDVPIGLCIADEAVDADKKTFPAGTRVFRADCVLTKFEHDEVPGKPLVVAVTAKPTYSANPPVYEVVGQEYA